MVPDHWIMQQDMTNLHSLTVDRPSDIHGASNYVVPILGSDGKPAAYVWLLDSSDDHCLGKTGWGCVYPDQVKWFRDTAKRLKEEDGRVVPGIMFHHIPLDEVNTAWNNLSIEINGSRGEPVCCASVNTGLFDAILEAGNIWGVFHGHDHNNDFVALYKGVHLGFGRKSGYGGYGGDVASQRGSRIFELRQGADGTVSWETWIREEAGARVEQQKLSFRLPGPAACCGTIELNQEYISGLFERRLEEGSSSLEEDRRACRAQDDAGACRRAAGQEQAISV
ncbi:unnamed protein product [Polarella glacialis]|uniref:Calcineurin-like phosphoesterase domain-containing protein n=2 Tax=Polarella glacialis TaxID=89957 RepID=A0A813LH58_POLGL|nr:unnamed protein product [Polarella glacialis]